ncbi:hypothetical protein DIE19_11120 [Burkholderia sp. Bp9126]|nr:hypothetical protein DIE19_11120 [Burkholderia sp. Bp9126]
MISHLERMGRLLLAALLGSVVGIERERQSDDDPGIDNVSVALSRTSHPEFVAICVTLQQVDGVHACRPDDTSTERLA